MTHHSTHLPSANEAVGSTFDVSPEHRRRIVRAALRNRSIAEIAKLMSDRNGAAGGMPMVEQVLAEAGVGIEVLAAGEADALRRRWARELPRLRAVVRAEVEAMMREWKAEDDAR